MPRPAAVRPAACAASLLLAGSAQAAQVLDVDVQRDDTRYRMHMSVSLNVPPAQAWQIFQDYARLPAMNPSVQLAQLEEVKPQQSANDNSRGASARLYTEVHVCVAMFCRTLHQTQQLLGQPAQGNTPASVQADVVQDPARTNDLRSGHAEWRFSPLGSGTRLDVDLRIEPAFWVPGMIGSWLLGRTLRDQAAQTANGIEALAHLPAPQP